MNERNIIIAVDFDGTLCENKYPDIGEPNTALIQYLIYHQQCGDKIILWTCRKNKPLDNAVQWCKEQGLEFDEVNNNLLEIVNAWGEDTRKICADIYIDDRAYRPDEII